MGRPRVSPLAPFLRSEAQARVLATILFSPKSLHIRAIADQAGIPYSVVQREIDRLETIGLVRSQRFAQARVVRPNEEHPQYDAIRSLLLSTHGPRPILAGLLRDLPHLENAYLFGSWAARYQGEPGSTPADLDVVVVGSPDRDRLDELAAEAESKVGQPVEITVVSPAAWKSRSSGFVRTVRARPLVSVLEDDS